MEVTVIFICYVVERFLKLVFSLEISSLFFLRVGSILVHI